jgi:hypothetical protein
MTDWNQRQLCPDGACVGIIGPDGLCKVCGRVAPNWGDERNRGLASAGSGETDEAEDDDLDDEDAAGDAEAPASAPSDNPDWDQRRLCPDDACIGVIGDDGVCKVCGRSAA